MKMFLILSLLVSESVMAGGGGGGCHYPDIESYTCHGLTHDNRKLKVTISKYLYEKAPHAYTSYAELAGKILAYMGEINTTRLAPGSFRLKSMKNNSVDAEVDILDLKRKTTAFLSGHAGVDFPGLEMTCTYNYLVQCP